MARAVHADEGGGILPESRRADARGHERGGGARGEAEASGVQGVRAGKPGLRHLPRILRRHAVPGSWGELLLARGPGPRRLRRLDPRDEGRRNELRQALVLAVVFRIRGQTRATPQLRSAAALGPRLRRSGNSRTPGIQVLLCLDYHGQLNTTPDYWGGGDNWKNNPYNAANGGPCRKPNDFFTSVVAKEIYKKRLRYLVARFGAFSNVAVWEFWNEIDNVIGVLNPPDVVAWHAEMAAYLKSIDPCRHLVSTSLSGRWWPELWSVAGIDLAQIHSYGQASPASVAPPAAAKYNSTFHKPVIVGEYGTDWRGYAKDGDPHSRGLHQALWGTLTSGFAGSAQTWWWESIHADNLYFHFKAARTFLDLRASEGRDGSPSPFPPRRSTWVLDRWIPRAGRSMRNSHWMRAGGRSCLERRSCETGSRSGQTRATSTDTSTADRMKI